jgi:hypothetical protein
MGLLESIKRGPVYAGDLKKSFFIHENSDGAERVRIHETWGPAESAQAAPPDSMFYNHRLLHARRFPLCSPP